MSSIFEEISDLGIVPVIAIDSADSAVPLAKAIIDGGLPCAEITFRTAAAEESIKRISEAYPEMLVGAGTVLTTEQADKAVAAGAKFIVSPGINPKVVSHCLSKGVPIIPGISTPSEAEQALELGLSIVKFFPAEAAGGLKMIKALAAPYTGLKFVPTGGVTPDNLLDYLAYDKVLACGGSWMATKDLISKGDFAKIEQLTRQAVVLSLGFSLKHVGLNFDSEETASQAGDEFKKLFGFDKKVGNSSIFASEGFELMKKNGRGLHGHIAIQTNSVKRAMAYLKRQGATFNESTLVLLPNGKPEFVYLNEEIGGFALHLKQK
ncbi:MAG: bifunctional 4-hydroxy-2-oxoglutarate aldolase/2-dehydro-3-deoxy-phosphogluconate aldolase [Clostridiales bacterium]|jgi:2-dehydro-3-deoxyphosphogluconate aldolase/(4S)-4-hydroxy-2-oxoglutarate aldolase|nr:bifunctional 4-hydroxy-2-oxoglutarate aldolase/2-dehydro-3-deoxy-phosphogluconate aldolase [Clostridiales bacterium]MDR2749059.1 bifunctional 4-hydroxy-2-oxoglutarate aldolase/2-dehydro-3-deoxy-phosphogluconate aldolase [Clostridiales bacterium]